MSAEKLSSALDSSSSDRVVNHGDFLTVDVAGLSDGLVASLQAYQSRLVRLVVQR